MRCIPPGNACLTHARRQGSYFKSGQKPRKTYFFDGAEGDTKLDVCHELITHTNSRGQTLRAVLADLRQSSDGSSGDLKASTLEEKDAEPWPLLPDGEQLSCWQSRQSLSGDELSTELSFPSPELSTELGIPQLEYDSSHDIFEDEGPTTFVVNPDEILEARSLGVGAAPVTSVGRSTAVLGSSARVKSAGPQRSAAAEARATARADFTEPWE